MYGRPGEAISCLPPTPTIGCGLKHHCALKSVTCLFISHRRPPSLCDEVAIPRPWIARRPWHCLNPDVLMIRERSTYPSMLNESGNRIFANGQSYTSTSVFPLRLRSRVSAHSQGFFPPPLCRVGQGNACVNDWKQSSGISQFAL